MIAEREYCSVHRAADGSAFEIRHCASTDELDLCIGLQQKAWGYPDLEVVPRNIYVLAQALGGHVFAAWDEQGGLAGFAMAVAAHEPAPGAARHWMEPVGAPQRAALGASATPTPYLHSHMLAVEKRYQNSGLGFALKQAQRADALARGIRCMRWTFDPRKAKNAFFNLRRLGVTVERYIPNFYGTLGSALQGGLPTDRLLAEWRLESDRVRAAAERRPQATGGNGETIALPAALANWNGPEGFDVVERMQRELRSRFQEAFGLGAEIVDFVPGPDGGGEYRLARKATHAFSAHPHVG